MELCWGWGSCCVKSELFCHRQLGLTGNHWDMWCAPLEWVTAPRTASWEPSWGVCWELWSTQGFWYIVWLEVSFSWLFFFPFCSLPCQRELFIYYCCSVPEEGGKGREYLFGIVCVGDSRDRCPMWVKCKCTVHRQCGVSCVTQRKTGIWGHLTSVLEITVRLEWENLDWLRVSGRMRS